MSSPAICFFQLMVITSCQRKTKLLQTRLVFKSYLLLFDVYYFLLLVHVSVAPDTFNCGEDGYGEVLTVIGDLLCMQLELFQSSGKLPYPMGIQEMI